MNPNKYVCTFCGRDWDDALHYGCPAAVINRPVLLRKFCDSEEEFKGIIDKWSQYKQSTSSAQPDNSSLKITPVKQKSMQSFECEKVNELGIKSGTEAMETDSTTDSLAFKQSSSSNIIPSHNIYHIEKEEDEKYFTPSVEAALSAITEDQIFGHICDEIYKDQDMNLQIPAEQEMIDSPKEIPSKTIKSIFFGYDGVIINISEYDTYINVLNSIQEGTQLKKLLNSFERGTGYLLNEAPDILSLVGYVLAKEKCLGEKNPIIENAIDLIHKSGKYKLAILTNNVFWKEGQTTLSIEPDPRFHYIIESCKIGHRKPEAYFYEVLVYQLKDNLLKYALHKMELTANECVFIDTLEKNCLGAEAVGIKSIWLKDGDSSTAIKELEKLLSIKLL